MFRLFFLDLNWPWPVFVLFLLVAIALRVWARSGILGTALIALVLWWGVQWEMWWFVPPIFWLAQLFAIPIGILALVIHLAGGRLWGWVRLIGLVAAHVALAIPVIMFAITFVAWLFRWVGSWHDGVPDSVWWWAGVFAVLGIIFLVLARIFRPRRGAQPSTLRGLFGALAGVFLGAMLLMLVLGVGSVISMHNAPPPKKALPSTGVQDSGVSPTTSESASPSASATSEQPTSSTPPLNVPHEALPNDPDCHEQCLESIGDQLADVFQDFGVDQFHIGEPNIDWNIHTVDKGPYVFTAKGHILKSQKDVKDFLASGTPQANAVKEQILNALKDAHYDSGLEITRALNGTGYIPVQILAPAQIKGTTYFGKDGEVHQLDEWRSIKRGDVLWFFVTADHRVIFGATLRADCGNPHLKMVKPRSSTDHVKPVTCAASCETSTPRPKRSSAPPASCCGTGVSKVIQAPAKAPKVIPTATPSGDPPDSPLPLVTKTGGPTGP